MALAWGIQGLVVMALSYAIAVMKKTFSEGYTLTTNNRMELMAAIVALEALKEHCEVTLSTDSNMCGKELPNGFITGRNAAGKQRKRNP